MSCPSQDASATNVQVPLDQWFYTNFTIKDGEASKSFQDLVDIYLRPGMMTIARSVDLAVLGRVHGFLAGPTGASAAWPTSVPLTARTTCWKPAKSSTSTRLRWKAATSCWPRSARPPC